MIYSPSWKPFPILKLPAEIRNCIWRNVVVTDGYITFREYMIYPKSRETGLRYGEPAKIRLTDEQPRQTSLLAVAFTCRQVYREVTPIYYGENIFRPEYHWLMVKTRQTLEGFANAIGSKNAGTIAQLHLYDIFWFPMAKHLSLLPNLKRLHFDKSAALDPSKMTAFAMEHTSLTVVYDGEVWGPEKWKLFPRGDLSV